MIPEEVEKEAVSIKILPETRDMMWTTSQMYFGPKRGYVWKGVDLAFRLFKELSECSIDDLEAVYDYLEADESNEIPAFKELIELLKKRQE